MYLVIYLFSSSRPAIFFRFEKKQNKNNDFGPKHAPKNLKTDINR